MTKMNRWFTLSIFLVCVIFGPRSVLAVENIKYYADPKEVIKETTTRSARVVVSELYSHPNEWKIVLRNIASGNKSWLKVAVALHPGSDAGSSEMLTLSVGEALENAPANVFKIALKEFQLDSVCGSPDVDDVRYNSYDLATKAISLRQEKVSTITDPKLRELGKKCIKMLEKSKSEIKRFYGVEKATQK